MSEPRYEASVAPQAPNPASPGAQAATSRRLLEQMQELLASVNADLAGLDADLQSSGARAADRSGSSGASAGSGAW